MQIGIAPATRAADGQPGSGTAEVIAAVDLGSNSFHMIVGELRHGQLAIIDRLRETVRLSEGLQNRGDLARPAKERALQCLSRFGERLRDMHASSVRAAGTSTLRRARDSKAFLAAAEQALGHPIEVISGIEEARLIYSGVTHSMPPFDGLRLVLDIGGGSTELILGQAAVPRALESLHLGCVAVTERYFEGGRLTRAAFDKARLATRLELRPVKAFFRGSQAVQAIGTSGTIIATELVARELGIIESAGLTREAVEELILRVTEFESIDRIAIPQLSERRAQVWPGGLAILVELLGVLRIGRLQVSDGALREGLLYDQLGRLQHEDARERSVAAMAARYHVDAQQVERVSATAAALLEQCKSEWNLESPLAARILDWAARLHEIGLDISHDGFQRHGAYIAENADMPGLPWTEQRCLAFLIATQRRQIDLGACRRLPESWRRKSLRLALLLRLAVLLNRSRSTEALPVFRLAARENTMTMQFPGPWLEANPLTVADLEREQGYCRQAGYELRVEHLPEPA